MKYYTIKEEFLPLWTNDSSVTSETVIDSEEVLRLARAWGKEEEELLEQLEELPVPETLQDLTGQESGIVIYPNGRIIVCNWSQFAENELPRVLDGIALIGYPEENGFFGGAQEKTVDDFRTAFPETGEILWDAEGVFASIFDGTYYWKDDFRATIFTLTNGTVVVAPKMWN